MSRLATTGFALFIFTLAAVFVPAAQAKKISAYPSPGVTVATEETTISFRGLQPRALGKITVRGSKSGLHRGRFKAHADRRGVSFVSNRNFVPRERVTVRSSRHTFYGTGTRAKRSYSFVIGYLVPKGWRKEKQVPPEGVRPPEWTTYKSYPLKVPKITIRKNDEAASKGLIFLAARTNGPMIVDETGELVYYRPGLRVTDFRVQNFRGRPVLTWWIRAEKGNRIDSGYRIVGSNYKSIQFFRAGNGYTSDPHEFTMASPTTAFVNSFRSVIMDLRRYGGVKETPVMDNIAQEIDLISGEVLWEWHSLGNIGIRESYMPVPKKITRSYDYFHLNSIERDKDGHLLLSARHTRGLYKVNRFTGKVMWRMGGKRSDFKLGKGMNFAYQHDFRRHPNGTYSILDNGAAGGPLKTVSRVAKGQVFRINEKNKTTTLIQNFIHPERLFAPSQGNTQVLPNGNVFVGWGPRTVCSEFTPDGEMVFDLFYSAVNVTYRCYRSPWVGRPGAGAIGVKSEREGADSRVWVSWNGDTRVHTWRVLAGNAKLDVAGQAARDGFETSIPVEGHPARFRLVGLDAEGKVIGRSKINQLGKLTR